LQDVNNTGPEGVSVFLTLHKSWDKIQPTEHIKLNQKVRQTSLRCFLYLWNKENSYKLKQEVFLDQCCLHLAKWSILVISVISDNASHDRKLKEETQIAHVWCYWTFYRQILGLT